MTDQTEAQTIAALALDAADPTVLQPGDIISTVVPEGAQQHIVDLEEYLERPRRKRGVVTLHDAGSFRSYVTAHRDEIQTAIYADIDTADIVAVLNDHSEETDAAGWGDHRAKLTLRETPAWVHWHGRDRQWMKQQAFAEHIEEGLPEIIDPPAADMLEVAQTFQATTKVNFKQSTLLVNGQRQFTYEETIDAKAGQKGTFAVPTSFTLGLAVFEGQLEGHRVSARFQSRIDGGDLNLRYLLERPHDVVKAAFETIVGEIEGGLHLLAYRGKPSVA